MTWCQSSTVADIIFRSRVDATTSPNDRKDYELQFLSLYECGVNIGDCLLEISMDTALSYNVRLNAALALAPLFNKKTWSEGTGFSDKSVAKSALASFFVCLTDDSAPLDRLSLCLIRCFAQIVTLDFPSDECVTALNECTVNLTAKRQCGVLLESVAETACGNAELWSYLANSVTSQLFALLQHENSPDNLVRFHILRFFIAVLSRRPKHDGEFETPNENNCLLLSEQSGEAFGTLLRSVEGKLANAHASEAQTAAATELEMLLSLCQRFTRVESVARILFEVSTNTLQVFTTTPQAVVQGLGPEFSALLEGTVESILCVFQTYPEVCRGVALDSFFSALVPLLGFGVSREVEGGEGADGGVGCFDCDGAAEDALKALVLDDEVAPLGCGGGSVADTAAAVVELFIENNECVGAAVEWFSRFAISLPPSTSVVDATKVLYLARALLRCCEEFDVSFCGFIAVREDRAVLYTKLMQLALAAQRSSYFLPFIHTVFSCFTTAADADVFTALLSASEELYQASASSLLPLCESPVGGGGLGALLRRDHSPHSLSLISSFAVYVGARTLYQCRSCGCRGSHDANISRALPLSTWAARAAEVSSLNDSAIGRYCCAKAMLYLVESDAPRLLGENSSCLIQCVRAICSVPVEIRQLVDVVRTLLEATLAVTPVPFHSCAVFAACFTAAIAPLQAGAADSSHLLYRGLASLCAAATPEKSFCEACCSAQFPVFLPFLCYHTMPGQPTSTFDDTTIRVYAGAFGRIMSHAPRPQLEVASLQAVVSCLDFLLVCCCRELYSAETISRVCYQLCVAKVICPAVVDSSVCAFLGSEVFSPKAVFSKRRKGYALQGACLLFSLTVIESPALVDAMLTQPADAGCGHMISWWLSLASFGDETCVEYFLTAVFGCLQYFSQGTETLQRRWSTDEVRGGGAVFRFRNLFEKAAPPTALHHFSFLQGLAFALLDLRHRFKPGKKLFTFPSLLGQSVHYASSVGFASALSAPAELSTVTTLLDALGNVVDISSAANLALNV